MIHGYGASNADLCLVVKNLVLNDYDVYAMDMRGQGESQGDRGCFDSEEDLYNDHWAFIFEACRRDKINVQKTPLFLCGRSFGGLVATKMAATTIGRKLFRAIILLSPFFKSF